MKKKLGIILLIILLMFNFGSGSVCAALPELENYEIMGVYAVELNSGSELINSGKLDERMYPASTTKLLTTLTALDYIEDGKEKITVGDELDLLPADSSVADLQRGEVLTYTQLYHALLLPSGNDAAIVLAVHAGRVIANDKSLGYKNAYKIFVEKMNEKAKSVGMLNSSFANPHGIDENGHYTTVEDMYLLAKEVIKNDVILDICKTTKYKCNTNKFNHTWQNTNLLLYKELPAALTEDNRARTNEYYVSEAVGLKTGYTKKSGNCLVYYAKNDDAEILGVMLHAKNRKNMFTNMHTLLRYAFDENEQFNIYEKDGVVGNINIDNSFFESGNSLEIYTKEPLKVYMEKDEAGKVNFNIDLNGELITQNEDGSFSLKENISKNDYVGKADIIIEGKLLGQTEVYATKKVVKEGFFNLIKAYIIPILIVLMLILFVVVMIVIKKKTSKKRNKRKKKMVKVRKVRVRRKKKKRI